MWEDNNIGRLRRDPCQRVGMCPEYARIGDRAIAELFRQAPNHSLKRSFIGVGVQRGHGSFPFLAEEFGSDTVSTVSKRLQEAPRFG
jgi:hypothetical protein